MVFGMDGLRVRLVDIVGSKPLPSGSTFVAFNHRPVSCSTYNCCLSSWWAASEHFGVSSAVILDMRKILLKRLQGFTLPGMWSLNTTYRRLAFGAMGTTVCSYGRASLILWLWPRHDLLLAQCARLRFSGSFPAVGKLEEREERHAQVRCCGSSHCQGPNSGHERTRRIQRFHLRPLGRDERTALCR